MPLPAPDPDEVMPRDLQMMASYMRKRYVAADDWLDLAAELYQDPPLPKDLLEESASSEQTEE